MLARGPERPADGVRVEDHAVPAADGFLLQATTFEPAGPGEPRRAVLINSATAVKRSYYRRYATFLAEEGLAVVSYDYRGVGGSRPPGPLRLRAGMRDWAQKDAAGLADWAARRWPDAKLSLIGHSFGGQALGLMPAPDRFDRALFVAAQSGYWGHWPGFSRYRGWALWHVILPALTHAAGYFPARVVGMGEDLPKGVALEWARWGRRPGYLLDDGDPGWREAYARVRVPIRSYSFADDDFAPAAAADALASFYRGAPVERRHVHPRELGVRAIGHWGFFREAFRASLWRESLDWLRATS